MSDNIHPLTAYRESHTPRLTMEELAEKIGVTKAAVSRWEARIRKTDIALLPRISKETGIPQSKLRPDLAALFEQGGQ